MEFDGSQPDFVAVLRSSLSSSSRICAEQCMSMQSSKSTSLWSLLGLETVWDILSVEDLPFGKRESCLSEIWVSEVLPNWESTKFSRRAEELYYMGAPVAVRGAFWKLAIGNNLQINRPMYWELCAQVAERRNASGGDVHTDKDQLLENMLKNLDLDVPRTMSRLEFFQENQPYNLPQDMTKMMSAFIMLRPDVGYSQPMLFVAAMLLLYMDVEDAFVCFVNLMDESRLLDFFQNKVDEIELYLSAFEELLDAHLPRLAKHFARKGLEPRMYLFGWIMSVYSRVLPVDLASRVWDLFVMEGDAVLFGAALAILESLEDRLLKMDFEECMYLLTHLQKESFDHSEIIGSVRARALTEEHIEEAIDRCQAH